MFSEFVIILERLMRWTLKVDKIRLQLFLRQESRRLSLNLGLMSLIVSQVVLRQRREGTSQQEHHFLRILGLQTAKDRRQRETSGNFRITNKKGSFRKSEREDR